MSLQHVADDFASLVTRYHTWALMAQQDIAMRYKRSAIGPFWISISMAVFVFGVGLLYGTVQGIAPTEFLPWIGTGMLVWTFIASVVLEGSHTVLESEGHLRSLRLPIPTLAARMVYRNLIIFGHNLLVIIILLLAVVKFQVTETALLAIPGLFLLCLFGWFTGMTLGPLNTRFRDLAQINASVMQILFFLTPIFWKPGVGFTRPLVYEANPFYHLLQMVRAPLMGAAPTDLNVTVSCAVVLFMGVCAFFTVSVSRQRLYLWL